MEGIMKFLILFGILVAADIYAALQVAIENARIRRRRAEWEQEEKGHKMNEELETYEDDK